MFFFPFRLPVLLCLFSDHLIVKLARRLGHNNGHGVNSLLTARSVQLHLLFFCQLFARQAERQCWEIGGTWAEDLIEMVTKRKVVKHVQLRANAATKPSTFYLCVICSMTQINIFFSPPPAEGNISWDQFLKRDWGRSALL